MSCILLTGLGSRGNVLKPSQLLTILKFRSWIGFFGAQWKKCMRLLLGCFFFHGEALHLFLNELGLVTLATSDSTSAQTHPPQSVFLPWNLWNGERHFSVPFLDCQWSEFVFSAQFHYILIDTFLSSLVIRVQEHYKAETFQSCKSCTQILKCL